MVDKRHNIINFLLGGTGIIFDYHSTQKKRIFEMNRDLKDIAAYFTLFGASTIVLPLFKLTDKQVLTCFQKLISETGQTSLGKICIDFEKSSSHTQAGSSYMIMYGLNAIYSFA